IFYLLLRAFHPYCLRAAAWRSEHVTTHACVFILQHAQAVRADDENIASPPRGGNCPLLVESW
ncbi:unnamed protein product, partial [Ectocarpus sp. 12 AP-2014]